MAAAPGHLVHGMGLAPEVPTWPAITAAEARSIVANYPTAGRLLDLRWHSPRPFSAAVLLRTRGGDFLLKRHHRSLRSAEALGEEHRLLAHLRDAGVSVPEVMIAGDGTGAIEAGDWSYELHRQAPGEDLYRERHSWTPYLSDRHAHAAGAALARMHRAAQDYAAPARPPRPLVASFSILPSTDPLAATEAYVAARPALVAFLAGRPWRRDLARLFERQAGGLAERLAGEPPLWTHGDWHPSNLLWAPDGEVRTIFDFGLADRTCALHDLATAIERAAIAWLELDMRTAIADPGAALALLAGYHSERPLNRDDIETIAWLLPLVHVEFALSEIDYFVGIVGEPAHAELAWDGYLFRHADWFLSPAGRDFLARLDGGAG